MKKVLLKKFGITLILLILISVVSCARKNTLKKIKKTGVITVLTQNTAHCYYIYRDTPMGFEYDLTKAFSDYLGVELKILTTTWEGLIEALKLGKGDLIAASMTITPSRAKLVDFSDEYLGIQQKVILHKENHQIKNMEDLKGKTIHVRRGTSYEERLTALKDEGLGLEIALSEDTPTEELIEMVAEKEIEITIADSNIALLNRRYYPDIKISFPIEDSESLGWAVRKGDKALLDKINEFFKKIKEDGTFSRVFGKYYANVEIFDYVCLLYTSPSPRDRS